jgi:hypothetical protein
MKVRDFTAWLFEAIDYRDGQPYYPATGTVLDSGWYGIDPGNGVVTYGMEDADGE